MEITPIGVVRSDIENRDEMPFEGVSARIELFPQYAAGLEGISAGSHIWVMGWFHEASRDSLQVVSRFGSPQPRGVFGLRSPHRPNPISLNACRLIEVDGSTLHVERLDLIDGTPVVDIKRYSPSWDALFSARSSRDLRAPKLDNVRALLDGMMVEASNFHGEACVGVAMGVRIMHHALAEWKIAQKDPAVVVHMAEGGCIADALQALTGATLGNGRMKVPAGRAFRLSLGQEKILAFQPKELPEEYGVEQVLTADIEELFSIRSETFATGAGPHGGRPPKSPPPAEKQAALLERVNGALVNGALPCAVAHRIAHDLGVGLLDVGWASDVAKVRITRCQLGCFK